MFEIVTSQAELLTQVNRLWIFALLVFSRTMGFISMAPLTSHKTIPALVKIGFGTALSLLIMPSLVPPEEIPTAHQFILQIFLNLCVGMMIGWLASLMLEIVKAGGEMINGQMALHAANLFDPGSQSQTTIMGRFFDILAITLFISIGGVEKTIQGLYMSYEKFPIIVTSLNLDIESLIEASGSVMTIGFILFAPILMILLIMDLILGLMSRAAPQINAFQISFTVKPAVGLLLLLLILPAFMPIIAGIFNNPLKHFH